MGDAPKSHGKWWSTINHQIWGYDTLFSAKPCWLFGRNLWNTKANITQTHMHSQWEPFGFASNCVRIKLDLSIQIYKSPQIKSSNSAGKVTLSRQPASTHSFCSSLCHQKENQQFSGLNLFWSLSAFLKHLLSQTKKYLDLTLHFRSSCSSPCFPIFTKSTPVAWRCAKEHVLRQVLGHISQALGV